MGYSPGTGSLFSDDFETNQEWEMGNGFGASPSPWSYTPDGGDTSFLADGNGPVFNSPSRHWAQRSLHPVSIFDYSFAFEFKAELNDPSYSFFIESEQRAPTHRAIRLLINSDGSLSLWTTDENGVFIERQNTGPNAIPSNQTRWIRFEASLDPSGFPLLNARIWSGGATNEPATWDFSWLDTGNSVERVHRLTLEADGPPGDRTWIDDLDVWGDVGAGVNSTVTEIWMVELSHLDIGFTEPPDDIEVFAKTHLDSVLDNLDLDPNYRWTIESSWWLEKWWNQSSETEHSRMVTALQEGRLKLTGSYANQTTTMLGKEEIIQNLKWSQNFAEAHGIPIRTWFTNDVPGSTFAVPEILKKSSIDYYMGGMNTSFGGRLTTPSHGDRPFWWEGPDGSRVLSWITFDSYAEAFDYGFSFFDGLPELYDKLGAKLPEQEEAGYPYPELMLFRGFDNHYQNFHVRNLVQQWNATYDTPKFKLSTAEEFMDYMRATYGDASFPVFQGDFGGAWSRSRAGSPHTRERARDAQRSSRTATIHQALTHTLDQEPYPKTAIDAMFIKLLESDEHTGAGGWPEYFTPEEMQRNNEIHLGYATDAQSQAASLVADGEERWLNDLPVGPDAVVVLNPLGRTRTSYTKASLPQTLFNSDFRLIDRSSGSEIPYQKYPSEEAVGFFASAVPPWGYKVFDLMPGIPTATPSGLLTATATTLENDFYLVTVDASDGSIQSLYDKTQGFELVDPNTSYDFNELATNTKTEYDSQAAPVAKGPTGATVAILENGPLEATLEVTRTGTAHHRTLYRLRRNEPSLEIENHLDRDLTDYVPLSTSVVAYTVTLPFNVQSFDIRTETTTRFLDPVGDSFDRTDVFDWHNTEHVFELSDSNIAVRLAAAEVGTHHIENLSSLTSSDYSNSDGLVLPRLYDRSDEYTFSGGTVGSYEREPGTSPHLVFRHWIQSAASAFNPTELSEFGMEATTPLSSHYRSKQPGNLPDQQAAGIHITGAGILPYIVRQSRDGSQLVIRMTELEGATTQARISSDLFTLTNAREASFDEIPGAFLAADGDGFLIDFTPYETKTILVEATNQWLPIQLLVNKDTSAGTVELNWTGGVGPFSVLRAPAADFADPTTVLDEQHTNSFSDPVLNDGQSWYYLVR